MAKLEPRSRSCCFGHGVTRGDEQWRSEWLSQHHSPVRWERCCGEGGLLRGYLGPDGGAKKLQDGPEVGWGDSPLPTKLLLGRSSPSALPRAARRGSLVCSATSGGPSYPSTKFLNGAHGEIAYSHLNNLKMAEQILLKLSPRTPLGAKPRLANFSPKRDLVQKRTRNWSWGGEHGRREDAGCDPLSPCVL